MLPWICGSETLTIVVSSPCMMQAQMTVAVISPRFGTVTVSDCKAQRNRWFAAVPGQTPSDGETVRIPVADDMPGGRPGEMRADHQNRAAAQFPEHTLAGAA